MTCGCVQRKRFIPIVIAVAASGLYILYLVHRSYHNEQDRVVGTLPDYSREDLKKIWDALIRWARRSKARGKSWHNMEIVLALDKIGYLDDAEKAMFYIQGRHESGRYRKCPGGCSVSKNFWGVKAAGNEPYVVSWTYENRNGSRKKVRARFRKFKSYYEAVNSILNTRVGGKRIRDILKMSRSLADYARNLEKYRYYTDSVSRYTSALIRHAADIIRNLSINV